MLVHAWTEPDAPGTRELGVRRSTIAQGITSLVALTVIGLLSLSYLPALAVLGAAALVAQAVPGDTSRGTAIPDPEITSA